MDKQVIGYTAMGLPLFPCEPGRIYTACLITCSKCGEAISAHGGPSYGATCVGCYVVPNSGAVIHYGMSKKEANEKHGSAGEFLKPVTLCGSELSDAQVTRSKQGVTCKDCVARL